MFKKFFSMVIIISLSVFMMCSCSMLDNYINVAEKNLDSFIQEKNSNDYIIEDWDEILKIISEGKNNINSASDKAEIDKIIENTKQSIDAILPKGGNNDFEFSATIDVSLIEEGKISIIVKTKNIGEPISYMGSSTKIGALAEIFFSEGDNTYSWGCEELPVNDDYEQIIIQKNEMIINTFIFNNNGEYGTICPSGVYSLRLNYKGNEKIYKDIINYN